MVKKLYEHFIVLYENILQRNPSIAAEHALKQEEEVYNNSTKLTYRNVCNERNPSKETYNVFFRLLYPQSQS